MGTESFVELLWRIYSKPGKVEIDPATLSFQFPIFSEKAGQPSTSYVWVSDVFPEVTRLNHSTFGEALG